MDGNTGTSDGHLFFQRDLLLNDGYRLLGYIDRYVIKAWSPPCSLPQLAN